MSLLFLFIFKVYDRLQPLGVTTSHCVMLRAQKQIGGHFNLQLINAVQEGKKFRLIGDNVNFMIDVSHQRETMKSHMEHWFGSMAIIQHGDFSQLSTAKPQVPLLELEPTTFLPQEMDWENIKNCYIVIILEILCKFCKYFQNFKSVLENMKQKLRPDDYDISEAHTSVPLPVLPKNEQKYSDVIEILDFYENIVENVCGVNSGSIHIGGDQLTRERFSGAKRLRAASITPKDRFEHLSPITFEFFHLQMSVLTLFYKLLYRKSGTALGTLNAEKITLGRTKANGDDVKNHYNDCRELADSFISGYVVNAVMHFFEMETINSQPNRAFAAVDIFSATEEEKEKVVVSSFGEFIDDVILKDAKANLTELKNLYQQVTCVLPDGGKLILNVPVSVNKRVPENRNDCVLGYGKTVLEIGLLYQCLNLNIKIPNREIIISLMKYIMCVLKENNNQSKYALEILRFLFLQTSLLDLKTAKETFYGLFVNQKGKVDTNIPADLHMEHFVKEIKEHLKSLHANKTESSVQSRSSAIAGMRQISVNYDDTTQVLYRAKRHSTPSSDEDELNIIHRLLRVRPFENDDGRSLECYTKPLASPLANINLVHLQEWIRSHQYEIISDFGI